MAETALGDTDHSQHRRRHRPIFLDEAIAHPFGFECELAQLREADHAAAAFEGMKAAAHGLQRFAVARIIGERAMTRGNRIQHFRGFEQVDLEELAIKFIRIGRQKALRLLGNFGRGRRSLGHGADGGSETCGFAARELLQCSFRLGDETGVADQFRVIAQSGQLLLQAFACRGMRGSEFDFTDKIRKRRAQLGNSRLDRVGRLLFRRRRLSQTLRNERGDQTIAVGTLLLHCFDIEPQARQ